MVNDDTKIGKCGNYNKETRECESAKRSNHIAIFGHLGIKCPYNAFVSECNIDYHSKVKFSGDREMRSKQLLAYIRYGWTPDLPIPLASLDLEGTLERELLAGTKIHYPGGETEIIPPNQRKPPH